MQESTTVRCGGCANATDSPQRCPFCEEMFCPGCFANHMNWERRNEELHYNPKAELTGTGGHTYTQTPSAEIAGGQRRRAAGKVFWKMNCDLCGKISLDIRECPVCRKKICREDYPAHMELEDRRAREFSSS